MIVGLTGGIGSGKSTAAEIFRFLGAPVFIADRESKILLEQDQQLQAQLKKLLGAQIVTSSGVDKAAMAERIFGDAALLQRVNAVIHPAVARRFQQWYVAQDAPYLLREAAILYETGTDADCDFVIVVTAPEALRLQRVQERSGETEQAIRRRMSHQMPQSEKDARADYLIHNYPPHSLINQIFKIHEDLIYRANARR